MIKMAFLLAVTGVVTPVAAWAAMDAYTPEIPTGAAPIVIALLLVFALLIRKRYKKAK